MTPRRARRPLPGAKRSALLLLLLCALIAGVGVGVYGCGDAGTGDVVLDEPIPGYLLDARAAHRQADQAELRGDRGAAIQSLEQLLARKALVEDDRIALVRADTAARLAGLQLEEGKLDEAHGAVERGMRDAPDGSLLQGRLFELKGAIYGAEARQLATAGLAATGPTERALSSLDRAAIICDAILTNARLGQGEAVVDETLVAYLAKASALSRKAELLDASERTAEAVTVLEALVAGPMPPHRDSLTPSDSLPAEVREVKADALASLADLRSAAGAHEQAYADVQQGLALVTERSHFRGRLMEVLGEVERRRSLALAEAGDAAGADEAKKRALAAYEEAMAIQEEVIMKSLPEVGAP